MIMSVRKILNQSQVSVFHAKQILVNSENSKVNLHVNRGRKKTNPAKQRRETSKKWTVIIDLDFENNDLEFQLDSKIRI